MENFQYLNLNEIKWWKMICVHDSNEILFIMNLWNL